MCSLAARGLWIEMLCLMHEEDGYLLLAGKPLTPKELARLSGGGTSLRECAKLLAELEENGVFSRTEDGTIYCRRMVRDVANEKGWREVGRLGGNPTVKRGTVPKDERVRPFKRTDSPVKTARILAKTEGLCFWCQRGLQSRVAGPDYFQVDHVIAVRDGGTNDEANLVPSCTICNLARSKSDHNPPLVSESNPTTTKSEIRPQPTKKLEPRVSEEQEKEERKILIKKPYFGEEMRARAEEREEIPRSIFDDELDRLRETPLADEPETFDRKPDEPLPEPFQVHVRRAAKAATMRIPYGETRSVEAQLEALKAQPQAVGADQTMGLRWQPAAPVRSIEEMRAAALAGCTPEQIARAERYARRAAA